MFIIDTNILIAALIKNSASRFILLKSKFIFYAPEHVVKEIYRYISLISKKAKLTTNELLELLSTILKRITIVPEEEYKNTLSEAKNYIEDVDDVPFVALALIKNLPIWSNDKHFQMLRRIKVYTTTELLTLL